MLLGEDVTGENGDVVAEESKDITKEGLTKMMVTMNENMVAMASSVPSLGTSLNRDFTRKPIAISQARSRKRTVI